MSTARLEIGGVLHGLQLRWYFQRRDVCSEQPGDPFDAVCSGCQTTCAGCTFEEPTLVTTCAEAMDHSNSSGGTGTLEMLLIESGYWRATPSSPYVLECYHAAACLGGVTGAAGYCLEGYEGPCECFLYAKGR